MILDGYKIGYFEMFFVTQVIRFKVQGSRFKVGCLIFILVPACRLASRYVHRFLILNGANVNLKSFLYLPLQSIVLRKP